MLNVAASMLINILLNGDNGDGAGAELGISRDAVSLSRGRTLTHGTGADNADVFFHDIIAVATTDEINFRDGSLKDAFNVGVAITKLKLLYIKNVGTVAITIGVAANPLALFGDDTTDDLVLAVEDERIFIFAGNGLTVGAGDDSLEFVFGGGGNQNLEIIAAGVE